MRVHCTTPLLYSTSPSETRSPNSMLSCFKTQFANRCQHSVQPNYQNTILSIEVHSTSPTQSCCCNLICPSVTPHHTTSELHAFNPIRSSYKRTAHPLNGSTAYNPTKTCFFKKIALPLATKLQTAPLLYDTERKTTAYHPTIQHPSL